MKNFLKGIIVGSGGISPGLSGSVLLIILGLYQETVIAIGTLFKEFKKNIKFLTPIILGFLMGIILFSKLVNFLLTYYERYTRFAFLGLILGTIPLFFKEVKKEGFERKYYYYILTATVIGWSFFRINKNLFPTITEPNLMQSVFLGIAIAGSSIVPGIDSAAVLSALGLYELYVSSVANLNLWVLIPAGVGVVIGGITISLVMNYLIRRFYTVTFSIVFGLFLSVVPSVLNESCRIGFDFYTLIAFGVVMIGFCFSYLLGDFEKIKKKLEKEKRFDS